MSIAVNDSFPNHIIKQAHLDGFPETSTLSLIQNEMAVIFALNGAFSPNCTQEHFPGFAKHFNDFKSKGVDRIICMSVNDPFVLKAFQQTFSEESIFMDVIDLWADWDAGLTKKLTLSVDGSAFGMGIRSQRFAMVVNKGVIKILEIDPVGVCDMSSAETILKML
jgi:peroxiredoxin